VVAGEYEAYRVHIQASRKAFPLWFIIVGYLIYINVLPRDSVDSRPRRENRSPCFDGFHLLCELVGTPPLTTTSEVCQISTLKLM